MAAPSKRTAGKRPGTSAPPEGRASSMAAPAHSVSGADVCSAPGTPAHLQFIWEMASGWPNFDAYGRRNSSIATAFEHSSLHRCDYPVRGCDLDRAVAENPHALVRSRRQLRNGANTGSGWEELVFQFGPQSFLCAESRRITAFSDSCSEAERLLKDFLQKYSAPAGPRTGFEVLYSFPYVESASVELPPAVQLSEEDFRLHYGEGAWEWHLGFVEQLRAKERGISFLEGPPGTGKTHYIRHLMGQLCETHRFYFLTPSFLECGNVSYFLEFWKAERERFAGDRVVLILEDGESEITSREVETNRHVSLVLNLADGLLSDFVKAQIICTVNCRVVDIDRALLRPGRLTNYRAFKRLSYMDAMRLAGKLNRRLKERRDYSLAEIYCGPEHTPSEPRPIGFLV